MSVIRAVQLQCAAQSSRQPWSSPLFKTACAPGLSIPFISPISATSQRGSQFSTSFSSGTSHSHSFPPCSHTHSSFPVQQPTSSLSLIILITAAFTLDGLIDFRHNHIHLPPYRRQPIGFISSSTSTITKAKLPGELAHPHQGTLEAIQQIVLRSPISVSKHFIQHLA